MKTKTKALILALCAVLLVVSTVFATLAFLTASDTVTNTFTFGKVGIVLDEATVDTAGKITSGADRTSKTGRTDANAYHLIPGHRYVKDPTIHVDADSENCLLFVKLENGLKPIIAATTIEDQMVSNGWTLIDSTNNIWAYNRVVAKNGNVDVFGEFTIKTDATVADYGAAKIIVTAYAVQADGFARDIATDAVVDMADAQTAWDATFANK